MEDLTDAQKTVRVDTGGDPRFLAEAPGWSIETFENWFRAGFSATADDPNGKSWELRFPPLALRFKDDPVDQIAFQLNTLAKVSQQAYDRACVALGRLFDHLGNGRSPIYVGLLLKLASTLRPPGVIEAARLLLQRESVQRSHGEWQTVVDTLVLAAASYGSGEAFSELVGDLSGTPFWRPIYALDYIVASIRRRPTVWLELLHRFDADLRVLEAEDPIAFRRLTRELIRYVRVDRIGNALLDIVAGEHIKLKYIAVGMFEGRNALKIKTSVEYGDQYLLSDDRMIHAMPIVPPNLSRAQFYEWMKFSGDHTEEFLSPEADRVELLASLQINAAPRDRRTLT
jgi:hypothetical protein